MEMLWDQEVQLYLFIKQITNKKPITITNMK